MKKPEKVFYRGLSEFMKKNKLVCKDCRKMEILRVGTQLGYLTSDDITYICDDSVSESSAERRLKSRRLSSE